MLTVTGYSRIVVSIAFSAVIHAQPQANQTAAQRVSRHFASINREVLDMAQDFPEDKYDFRQTKEQRSFGETIVHIASGNVYAAKFGSGQKVQWDELDAANYKGKAAIVALLQKSYNDATATMKANPEGPNKNLEPYLSVLEHTAEHYGLLVAYYRANGLVPPASRPKK